MAVVGVGEPDAPVVGVDDHVVDAVEGPAVEGADERVACVGRGEGGDVYDAVLAGVGEVALGAEEDAVVVVDAAVSHGEVGRGDLFDADRLGVGRVVEAGDEDGFVGVDEFGG